MVTNKDVEKTLVANAEVLQTLNFLNKKSGLPLGFLFAWPFPTPPDGAIQCNGAQYNRTLYADFYAYISSKGWVKTEAEWQSTATANGGYCPWYSDGDGSTTFRTPRFAPFMQIAIASGSVGTYHQAGLPNITSFNTDSTQIGGWSHSNENLKNGALSTTRLENWGPRSQSSYRDGYHHMISLDASKSSSVYGSSETVQPEAHEWMICAVVAGQATNIGSVDVGNVMSAVAQVQADLPNKLNNTTPHIVDTWKDSQGNWYRVWSDGFIEQGGKTVALAPDATATVTFPLSFQDEILNKNIQRETNTGNYTPSFLETTMTGTKLRNNANDGAAVSLVWYVSGY